MIARNAIFWPVLVQVLMTLLVYVRLINVKVREMRAGKVDMARRGLHEDAWPDSVLLINNNIRNQFELPVLFYVVCLTLWALEGVGVVALVAAWLFVLSRVAHAWVHLTRTTSRIGGGCLRSAGGFWPRWCCWRCGSSSGAH